MTVDFILFVGIAANIRTAAEWQSCSNSESRQVFGSSISPAVLRSQVSSSVATAPPTLFRAAELFVGSQINEPENRVMQLVNGVLLH